MPDNGRVIELLAEMLEEQRKTNRQLESVESRLERLETQQIKTNTLLVQYGRDIVKIVELLDERVVHWGDTVNIDGDRGISGVVTKIK